MPDRAGLISVFEEARTLLALPDNDFAWSGWEDSEHALAEVDGILSQLRSGKIPYRPKMSVLFAPTGPIQEVSLSSGWGQPFLELADRFDAAMAAKKTPPGCGCLDFQIGRLVTVAELGMDSRFGEASLLECPLCHRRWLRYFYEVEAFTKSGRWYLGAVSTEQAATATAEQARSVLEGMDWYYYGGSYFNGETGKGSGQIILTP